MTKGIQLVKYGHSPTLKTVLMVEKALRKAGEMLTLAQLKRKLPRQVMHQTLLEILDYLQWSGKILVSAKGVVWIYSPPENLAKMKLGGLEI